MLKELAKAYNIDITDGQEDEFHKYQELLRQWNEKVNLTAIKEIEDIYIKHFLDSLLILNTVDIPQNSVLIDVGTGAGFPGVPLKIMRNDIRLTLLDSLNKRLVFLQELSKVLNQQNHILHSRAEELGHNKLYREKHYIVTARAVADMRELAEFCMPFVKVGGIFVALKGYDIEQELYRSQGAIKQLGGEVIEVKKFILPQNNKRSIIVVKKISQTPPKYPRQYAKIIKTPII